jgi:hypothetical protein
MRWKLNNFEEQEIVKSAHGYGVVVDGSGLAVVRMRCHLLSLVSPQLSIFFPPFAQYKLL